MEDSHSSPWYPLPQSGGLIGKFRVPWSTFVKVVLTITVEAYQLIRQEGVACRDWEEDTFTVRLTENYIQPLARQHPLNLIAMSRTRAHTPGMGAGEISPKQAPEIDIRLFNPWENYNQVYFAWECKRISDKRVDEKHAFLVAEYVANGIFRFIDGVYASEVDDAGMLGYVLAGDVPSIVDDINQSMVHPRRVRRLSPSDQLVPASAIVALKDVYQSQHKRLVSQRSICLHHLFLTFDFVE